MVIKIKQYTFWRLMLSNWCCTRKIDEHFLSFFSCWFSRAFDPLFIQQNLWNSMFYIWELWELKMTQAIIRNIWNTTLISGQYILLTHYQQTVVWMLIIQSSITLIKLKHDSLDLHIALLLWSKTGYCTLYFKDQLL